MSQAKVAQEKVPSPVLDGIHHAVKVTHHYQDKRGVRRTPYMYAAEHSRSLAFRQWVLHRWKHRALHAVQAYRRSLISVASSTAGMMGALACISAHEEYGLSGQNTIAGYFGFVFSPASYGGVAASLAAQYGNSWLDIPQSGQIQVALMLHSEYGWGPWSTAGVCGLS